MSLNGKMNVMETEGVKRKRRKKRGSLTRSDRKEEEKNLLFVSGVKACAQGTARLNISKLKRTRETLNWKQNRGKGLHLFL